MLLLMYSMSHWLKAEVDLASGCLQALRLGAARCHFINPGIDIPTSEPLVEKRFN